MRWWTAVAVFLVVLLQAVEGSKVLFLGPISSKSHKNFYSGIVNALADHGHQVTMVSPFKPSKERKNVREVDLPDVDIQKIIPNLFAGNKLSGPLQLMQEIPTLCSDALAKPAVQNLLKEDFDLVLLSMFGADCFLSVVHQLKVPFILVVPAGLMVPFSQTVGNPEFPSYDHPNHLLDMRHPLTFTERAINIFVNLAGTVALNYYVSSRAEAECRRRGLCPDDMPSLQEMRHNASLLIVNSVETVDYPPRPTVPAVIHCGGIHCHAPQPLPKDLEEWVRGAGDDGFIFFSLGSAVKPSSMPEEYRKILVEVFGSLKQRVLWKWDEDTMADKPSNVRLGKWLPQQDILGDPRLRLFITHGGILSTYESMYHGIPVLGMPVFGDQQTNMMLAEKDGWGRVLFWKDLTADRLRDMISDVMTNPSLKAEVQRRSAVMKDRLMHPAQVAVYWVEYVMRHNGAPHLRCPSVDMPWYKLYNVDVWATVTVVLLLVAYVSLRLFIAFFSWLCGARSKAKTD